ARRSPRSRHGTGPAAPSRIGERRPRTRRSRWWNFSARSATAGAGARAAAARGWRPPPSSELGRRRKAREVSLQSLYQLDVEGESNPDPHLDEFWSRHPVEADGRHFGEALVRGTKLHEEEIDEIISQYAEHWPLDRMAVVDRNILRQGICELLWLGDAP